MHGVSGVCSRLPLLINEQLQNTEFPLQSTENMLLAFLKTFIKFIGVTLVNKSIQFQVYNSVTHHRYVVCSPPQVKSPSTTICPPFTLLYLPHDLPSGHHHPLSVSFCLVLCLFWLTPFTFPTQPSHPSLLPAVSLFSVSLSLFLCCWYILFIRFHTGVRSHGIYLSALDEALLSPSSGFSCNTGPCMNGGPSALLLFSCENWSQNVHTLLLRGDLCPLPPNSYFKVLPTRTNHFFSRRIHAGHLEMEYLKRQLH